MQRGKLVAIAVASMLMAHPLASQASDSEFRLVDLRPAQDFKARTLSLSIFSCDFAIRMLNDEGRTRDRINALAAALRSKLGTRLEGHTLEILAYRLAFNESKESVGSSIDTGLASVGVRSYRKIPAVATPKCSEDKTSYGWFNPTETTNGNSPLVIDFEGKFDGNSIKFRSVYSPSRQLSTIGSLSTSKAKKNLYDKVAAPEVDKAIDIANDKVVSWVEKLLPS